MPALLADPVRVFDPSSTYEKSVALEDLWQVNPRGVRLIPGLKEQMNADLIEFLTEQQSGARSVTRSMVDLLLQARLGMYNAIVAQPKQSAAAGEHDDLGAVFRDLPQDPGHWGTAYIPHALQGLHPTAPDYVLDLQSGKGDVEIIRASLADNVAGVVVVSMPPND